MKFKRKWEVYLEELAAKIRVADCPAEGWTILEWIGKFPYKMTEEDLRSERIYDYLFSDMTSFSVDAGIDWPREMGYFANLLCSGGLILRVRPDVHLDHVTIPAGSCSAFSFLKWRRSVAINDAGKYYYDVRLYPPNHPAVTAPTGEIPANPGSLPDTAAEADFATKLVRDSPSLTKARFVEQMRLRFQNMTRETAKKYWNNHATDKMKKPGRPPIELSKLKNK